MALRTCGRRDDPDVQVPVEEQRGNVGAVHHVFQVIGRRPLAFQSLLEMAIERGRLFVEGLKFLLRGQKLFVCGLELLIDGQSLLVDRALLIT